MLQKLEKRWANWKQPLLFLATVFHPYFCVQAFSDQNYFTLEQIVHWVEYYYEIWFKNIINAILEEEAINQKDISKVAFRLFGIKVNSAPCEHLFSRMGWFHNLRRNRLQLQTVFQIAQIAAKMKWEKCLEDTKKIQKETSEKHAFVPTKQQTKSNTADPTDDNHTLMLDDEDITEETASDDDNSSTENSDFDNNENEPDEPNEPDANAEALDAADVLNCHSADHTNSKTQLQYLFSRILSSPLFVCTLRKVIETNEILQ
ncbi:15056_t:CDS:2 [Dentiscutata erythropus]|uniref:15056_t:CDS:1 n=1 Tax=Dentiscutata erythropus TaxID=1348616 RepID=A0A9N9NEV6_9GLOM|nr:15056_t:CDS:2 [Dentiscutata erythropus]